MILVRITSMRIHLDIIPLHVGRAQLNAKATKQVHSKLVSKGSES